MSRLQFNAQGQLTGVNKKLPDFSEGKKLPLRELKTSKELEFLKPSKKLENIYDKSYWSLYENSKPLKPLKFSNSKTQEDIVKEIVNLIKKGEKVIFLHGVCGTGKSAIALNLARVLGKASIVVPIKSLQKQYEEDYMGKKHVVKQNGEKLKIAMITGRDNHDSIISPGKSCADPLLPDTIKLTDKNYEKIKSYYGKNPFITNKVAPPIKSLRRISIAPANPHWSPILPSVIELNQLKDAKKKQYAGMHGKKFIFYHRKPGCSYYDQYLSYFNSDVIIFNSAKYLAETSLGRKPQTAVEIIDEADEFLDSFSNSVEINLTRLEASLKTIYAENEEADYLLKKIIKLIDLEEKNKKALGIDENKIYEIKETRIQEILKILSGSLELQAEIELDDINYSNTALEAAKDFKDSFKDTYITYRKEDESLYTKLITTNLSKKFKEIVEGNKAIILMSGTLHSPSVLKNVFGIENFSTVEAETLNQGSIEIYKTGKEFDCKYSNFRSKLHSRKDYLNALSTVIAKADKPSLIHVNAYSDLPTADEVLSLKIFNIMIKEELRAKQKEDKEGSLVSEFKQGKSNILFTTKCSRGIDFPGDTCKSVIFTKYPNPNVKDTFWKVLQKTHPDHYWEFYKDKARREFLQRIYRAVRSKDDHVFVLSPDIRVLNAVRELQEKSDEKPIKA
jgi:Rad3-related DNA helicase